MNKLLGVGALSLATLGAGAPALAADVTCPAQSGLEECFTGEVSRSSTSFTGEDIGTLSLSSIADALGFLHTPGMDVSSMTLTSGSTSVSSNRTGEGFAFDDVASGNYTVSISGLLTGPAIDGVHTGLYNGGLKVVMTNGPVVTPIPEPETFALLLAGLATLGVVSRKRAKG